MTTRDEMVNIISIKAAQYEGVIVGNYDGWENSLNSDIRFPNLLSAALFADDATRDLGVEIHLKRPISSFGQIVYVTIIKVMS